MLAQVQLGPKTTSNGIRALAGLPDLRACSFECYDISTKALKTISSLKDLTCVEVIYLSAPISCAYVKVMML